MISNRLIKGARNCQRGCTDQYFRPNFICDEELGHPHARRTMLFALVWALGRFPEKASDTTLWRAVDLIRQPLSLGVSTRQEDLRPLAGARGIVRLFLFYGAEAEYMTRSAVSGSNAG
jgi:hypothetical protein